MEGTPLVFSVNGTKYSVRAEEVHPLETLNSFLRWKTPFKGTKLGCGEGGCGACAVDLSRLDPATGNVIHTSCNSCLRPIAAMDGFNVTTTDGLGNSTVGFHPVQDRIASFGGSQCGYCTPGMVMTMYSSLKQNPNMSMLEIEERFDGNICRCTGYRPILAACKSFAVDTDIVDEICHTHVSPHDSSNDPPFPSFLKAHAFSAPLLFKHEGIEWVRPSSLSDALAHMKSHPSGAVRVVVGNTGQGIYKDDSARLCVDLQHIPQLLQVTTDATGLTVGAATTLANFIAVLKSTLETTEDKSKTSHFPALIRHSKKIANVHVRGVGSIGGNIMLAKTKGFLSDLATILQACRASCTLVSESGTAVVSIQELLSSPTLASGVLLQSVTIPWVHAGIYFNTYKTALRPQNSHAWVNAGFIMEVDAESTITDCQLTFGGVMPDDDPDTHPVSAPKTEAFLKGKTLNQDTLSNSLEILANEIVPADSQMRREFRQSLISSFYFKFFVEVCTRTVGSVGSASVCAVADLTERGISTATHAYATIDDKKSLGEVGQAHPKRDSWIQAAGEAVFTGDMRGRADMLYASLVQSTEARAKIVDIDTKDALAFPGVVAVVTSADIPGVNNIETGFFMMPPNPHPILADGDVFTHGQPVAAVVAETQAQADAACHLVRVKYDTEGLKPLLSLKESKKAYLDGDKSLKWLEFDNDKLGLSEDKDIEHFLSLHSKSGGRVQGVIEVGSQQHFYMETQSAMAEPDEDKMMTVYSATQWLDAVQHCVSKVLDLPMHQLRMVSRRCGGAFGGKAINAAWVASIAAIAAAKVKRPVRLMLDRNKDMKLCGGREELYCEYDVAYGADGRIHASKTHAYFNSGWDLDFSIGSAMSFPPSFSQGYQITHQQNIATLLRSNLPGRTAVRGPAELASSFAIEHVIEHVAHALGLDPMEVRETNLYDLDRGEMLDTKGKDMAESYTLDKIWARLKEKTDYATLARDVNLFNSSNKWKKRGVAVVPVKYGVTQMTKAGMVNIYGDGSVVVTHAASEMGQGANMKILQVTALELSRVFGEECGDMVSLKHIRISENDSRAVPNSTVTGGSTGSETAAKAVQMACQTLVDRLKPVLVKLRAKKTGDSEGDTEGSVNIKDISWEELCAAAKAGFVNLSAQELSGAPLSYKNWGAGLSVVEVDVLTGETCILRTDLVYDCGRSLNPSIDIGQVEGAFLMGVGQLLREEVLYRPDGSLLSDGTWEYKPPGAKDVPLAFNVELIQNETFKKGVLSSKASGEPPNILAVSVAMAIHQALRSSRKDNGLTDYFVLPCPMTPDVIQRFSGVNASSFTMD